MRQRHGPPPQFTLYEGEIHMAQARERLLAFRKQMAAETAPQPTAAGAASNPNVAGGGN